MFNLLSKEILSLITFKNSLQFSFNFPKLQLLLNIPNAILIVELFLFTKNTLFFFSLMLVYCENSRKTQTENEHQQLNKGNSGYSHIK